MKGGKSTSPGVWRPHGCSVTVQVQLLESLLRKQRCLRILRNQQDEGGGWFLLPLCVPGLRDSQNWEAVPKTTLTSDNN